MLALSLTLAFLSTPAAATTATGVRSVFLNGVDISSAKSQDLKTVDIHINEQGDLFIIAPHYQVNEEDTYVPLSKYVQGLNQPAHKAPQAIEAGFSREAPTAANGGGLLPKAGEVLPAVNPPPVAMANRPAAGTPPVNPATAAEASGEGVAVDPAVPAAAGSAAAAGQAAPAAPKPIRRLNDGPALRRRRLEPRARRRQPAAPKPTPWLNDGPAQRRRRLEPRVRRRQPAAPKPPRG